MVGALHSARALLAVTALPLAHGVLMRRAVIKKPSNMDATSLVQLDTAAQDICDGFFDPVLDRCTETPEHFPIDIKCEYGFIAGNGRVPRDPSTCLDGQDHYPDPEVVGCDLQAYQPCFDELTECDNFLPLVPIEVKLENDGYDDVFPCEECALLERPFCEMGLYGDAHLAHLLSLDKSLGSFEGSSSIATLTLPEPPEVKLERNTGPPETKSEALPDEFTFSSFEKV